MRIFLFSFGGFSFEKNSPNRNYIVYDNKYYYYFQKVSKIKLKVEFFIFFDTFDYAIEVFLYTPCEYNSIGKNEKPNPKSTI